MSRHVLAIRRLIWYVLLYCSGFAGGHMYDRRLIYLYLCDEAGLASVQRELPFCLGHVVAGLPHCTIGGCISAPPRQTEVAICALGNF